jgi:hypothetical protein
VRIVSIPTDRADFEVHEPLQVGVAVGYNSNSMMVHWLAMVGRYVTRPGSSVRIPPQSWGTGLLRAFDRQEDAEMLARLLRSGEVQLEDLQDWTVPSEPVGEVVETARKLHRRRR